MDREAWRAIVHGERVRHDWATNTFHSELTNENTVLWIHIYSFTSLPHNSGRRQWQPTPVLLPGKSQGRRSLVGYSPWGREESDTTKRLHFTFHFHALEKAMATHSSVLAWRIPGTGEPGGLLSMWSHRVRHDWSDLAAAATTLFSVLFSILLLYCFCSIFGGAYSIVPL